MHELVPRCIAHWTCTQLQDASTSAPARTESDTTASQPVRSVFVGGRVWLVVGVVHVMGLTFSLMLGFALVLARAGVQTLLMCAHFRVALCCILCLYSPHHRVYHIGYFCNESNGRNIAHSERYEPCLLYTSPSPRDRQKSRMPSSA